MRPVSAALALNAGVDIDMMSDAYFNGLPIALERGLVSMDEIDMAVRRVLTFKEQGYPELQLNEVFAFFASSKTPKAVQRELEAAIVAAARSPRLVAAIEKLEFDSDVRSSADLARLLKEDFERWGPVIKATGYTAEN